MSNQSNQNNHFNTRSTLQVNQQTYTIFNLNALPADFAVHTLPYSLKILLENLLRCENGRQVTAADIEALAKHDPTQTPTQEIAFTPSRVLLQDFTGVPAIVDLAAMREAMRRLQGDPGLINPLQTAELVIDHSVQVDDFGHANSLVINTNLEFARNRERYEFLRWGQQAFSNFTVVPPDMGIVHQINLEYLARGVFTRQQGDEVWAYPDTLVGTDSHTTMINGLGVLGWGVGGIEAEAALLGQAISMLIPAVIGFELTGQLPEGTTATDLVLTITQQLRAHGVVGKLVEFYGAGLDHLPLADRATIANMAPEYGATCGFFPIDQETLRYLQLSGRDPQHIALVEAYSKAQGLFRQADMSQCRYSERLCLDMSTVRASIAGPKRPQDRMDLSAATAQFQQQLPPATAGSGHATLVIDGKTVAMTHGAIVIAAITSCTNTSNPSVMLAAGLLAKKARERGLKSAPWVKTSLSPGSKVVTEYLQQAGLLPYLQQLGFYHVGYGCMTCIGNSGPLPPEVSQAIQQGQLITCSVLSGNRNFEGRIHAEVRLNYLVSPPLVVAYALTGNMNIDISREALGYDSKGNPVLLRDIWPSQQEINQALSQIDAAMFQRSYATINQGDAHWNALAAPTGELFAWDERSTYIKHPPFFANIQLQPQIPTDIHQARVLAWLGDSVTTDHISPAGSIKPDSPAGVYLQQQGVAVKDFNSYGARRGNHEVMMRGTFANTRLRNRLAPGTEGGWTVYGAEPTPVSIYDAAMRYQQAQIPLIILAGKEYGSGSSRDWAAKGPRLLGIQAVIAESYERIHRSNLVGMGILPLQFQPGETAESLGLTGTESYSIQGIQGGNAKTVQVIATAATGTCIEFTVGVRMDTPQEIEYYQHGGILPFVLRQLLGSQHHG